LGLKDFNITGRHPALIYISKTDENMQKHIYITDPCQSGSNVTFYQHVATTSLASLNKYDKNVQINV